MCGLSLWGVIDIMNEGDSSEGLVVRLENILDKYHEARSWTGEGQPKSELLKELGIEEYGIQAYRM